MPANKWLPVKAYRDLCERLADSEARADALEVLVTDFKDLAVELEEALTDLRVASGCTEYVTLNGTVDVDSQVTGLRTRLAELTGGKVGADG